MQPSELLSGRPAPDMKAPDTMTRNATPATQDTALKRFLRYLEQDPNNLSLLLDSAQAAFNEQDHDMAAQLLARHSAMAPLPAFAINLAGMTALAQQKYAEAAQSFETLRTEHGDNPALRFNLAWAHAMAGSYAEALELLDDDTVAVSAKAPALKIHMMHHLEQYEEALECGAELAEQYPENLELMGALSTLALDADMIDLARSYGQAAGDDPEGLATLGMLLLEEEPDQASTFFSRALDLKSNNPRAWVGQGLGLLADNKAAEAAQALDKGAHMFGDHLGTWIAAGWAHFANGNLDAAQDRFERVTALDPTFSEGHGGLAVIALAKGRIEEARHLSDIALRLDRNSLGGALATVQLLEADGDLDKADRIRQIALSTPIGPNGKSIAQALAAMQGKQLH